MGVTLYIVPLVLIALYSLFITRLTKAWNRTPDWIAQKGENSVKLSIIIPYRNENGKIASCLKSLQNQENILCEFEIICVDDHSSDGSRDRVNEISTSRPAVRSEFLSAAQGKKMALAHGISCASGNWIATLDADVVVGKNWLNTLADFISSSSASMIIMPVMFNSEKTFFGDFQIVELLSLQGVTASSAFLRKPLMCNGANLAFSKLAYERLNGNLGNENISSGDDMFLLEKFQIERQGNVAWLKSKDVIARTDACFTVGDFLSQRIRWASKFGAYRNFNVIAVASITWLANASLMALFIAGISPSAWVAYFVLLLWVKSFYDYSMVKPLAEWFGKEKAMSRFSILPFLYVFYSTLVPLIGIFYRPKWKGRTISIKQ